MTPHQATWSAGTSTSTSGTGQTHGGVAGHRQQTRSAIEHAAGLAEARSHLPFGATSDARSTCSLPSWVETSLAAVLLGAHRPGAVWLTAVVGLPEC